MLGNDFRRMYNKLKGEHESRAETCYSYTSKILSNLLGALFIRKRFSPKVKTDVSITSTARAGIPLWYYHIGNAGREHGLGTQYRRRPVGRATHAATKSVTFLLSKRQSVNNKIALQKPSTRALVGAAKSFGGVNHLAVYHSSFCGLKANQNSKVIVV